MKIRFQTSLLVIFELSCMTINLLIGKQNGGEGTGGDAQRQGFIFLLFLFADTKRWLNFYDNRFYTVFC